MDCCNYMDYQLQSVYNYNRSHYHDTGTYATSNAYNYASSSFCSYNTVHNIPNNGLINSGISTNPLSFNHFNGRLNMGLNGYYAGASESRFYPYHHGLTRNNSEIHQWSNGCATGYVYNPKEARARKAERDAIKNHRVGNIPIPTNQQPQPPINQPPHMLMAPRNYGMEDMSHQSSQQPSNEQMNRTKPSLNFRPDLPPFPGFNHEFAPPYQFENPIPSCSETEMFNHGSQYPFEEVNLNSNWNFDRFIPQDYPIPESNLSNTNDIPNLMISNDDFSDEFHYRKSGSSLNILTPKALNSTVEISEQNNLLPKQSKDLYKQRSLSPDHILPYNNRETDYSETYTEVNNIHMTTSPDYDIKVTSPKSSPIEKSRLMSPVTMYKSKNISVQEQLPTQYKLSEPRDIQLSTNNFSKISNNDTSKQQSLDLNYQFNNQTVSKVHENGILSKTQNSEYRKSPKVHRSDRRSPSCKYESKKSPKQNNAFKQSISASKSKQIEIYPLPAFKQAFGGTERGRLLASPDKNSSSDITQCSGLHHSPKNNSVHESDFEYFNLNVFSENSNKFNFDEINQPFSESI